MEALNKKLSELTEEEFAQVTGGDAQLVEHGTEPIVIEFGVPEPIEDYHWAG